MSEFGSDPAVFNSIQRISPEIIEYLFKCRPMQPFSHEMPTGCFPKNSQGRSFHDSWFWKKLPSGESVRRKWMSYSRINNRLYCVHCALFGKNRKCEWVCVGFSDWKNGPVKICRHEVTENHTFASIKALYKEAAFPLIQSMKENEMEKLVMNKEVIKNLIEITLYLSRHSLPFRGHREGWQDKIRGNFKDLTILLAKYSSPLASHLTEIQLNGKHTYSFISWQRQNQLIQAIATHIRNSIKNELNNAKYFAVSVDTTFDISRKEQLSIVFRYINKNTGNVCERLIAVRETLSTTGEHLFTMFNDICEEMDIDWKKYLIGQSYDGAASMRGAYNGLQAIMKEHNPSATYVWCWAHRFSLVIVDAVSSCTQAKNLFGNLETLYDYIGSSKKRVGLYSQHQKKKYPGKPLRRLKRVETTRWSSHAAALHTVFETYDSLIDTLEELQNDVDRITSVKAGNLMNYLLSESFILTGFIFKQIFELTNPLSTFLQGVQIDLLAASEYIQCVFEKIKAFRDDKQFEMLIEDKNQFISSKSDELSFTPLVANRRRAKKKMPGEIMSDELISCPLTNFKVNTYFTIIDIVCTQIRDRFNDQSTPLYKDLSLFQVKRIIEVKEKSNLPTDAFEGFEKMYGQFVKAEDLRREYKQFVNSYLMFEKLIKLPVKIHKPIPCDDDSNDDTDEENNENQIMSTTCGTINTVYKVCQQNGLKEVFPAIYTALSIGLTLPVSSSSPERAFSKLKLIKSKLRSTMAEERLDSLMLISCENDIDVDSDSVINIFTSYSSVLKKILC